MYKIRVPPSRPYFCASIFWWKKGYLFLVIQGFLVVRPLKITIFGVFPNKILKQRILSTPPPSPQGILVLFWERGLGVGWDLIRNINCSPFYQHLKPKPSNHCKKIRMNIEKYRNILIHLSVFTKNLIILCYLRVCGHTVWDKILGGGVGGDYTHKRTIIQYNLDIQLLLCILIFFL